MHRAKFILSSILLFMLLGFEPSNLIAQDFSLIKTYEDSLLHYSSAILKERDDDKKFALSKQMEYFVEKAARQKSSIEYGFDTLNYISVLTSDDKKFRVFTWTIKKKDGTYKYYGLSQSFIKTTKSYKYNRLNDQTSRLRRSDSKTLNPKKWLGAYYYKLIQNKANGKIYYTLLGWKGLDKVASMKVIEVATVRSNGDVTFGYPIFSIKGFDYVKNKRARRLVFKYSAQIKMYLDYDVQSIHIEKKKKKSSSHKKQRGFTAQNKDVVDKVKVKTITKPMIVMDRLEPINTAMEGIYEFYYPETNVIDALLFENNRWTYYPDVDARNKPTEEINAKPKKKLNYDL